jgi:hypothetical protein
MVSKCHNPRCTAEFRYFGDGKLFAFPPDSAGENSELFWLCATCYNKHTLVRGEDGHIRLATKRGRTGSDEGWEKAS